MKKTIILLTVCILIFSASIAFAQESDVIYIEGWVDIKDGSGEIYELFTGDRVYYGDTVITSYDGIAELEPQRGSRIIVKPDTVFSIKQTDVNGRKQSVVSTTLGQVSFKFNKMTNEPLISTPSTVMGVRGTEFTVFAGADGSSLVTVESGAVEVSGKGGSVLLEKSEGVEIKAGMAPGEKFPVKGKPVDFADWNNKRIDSMMENPSEALFNLADQIEILTAQVEEWADLHEAGADAIIDLTSKMNALFDEGKDDEAKALYKEQLRPLEITSLRYVMNYRYYALSILSMRQHVLSGFYIRMKTAFISDRDNPVYTGFLNDYKNILKEIEVRVGPYLVKADY